MPSTWSRRCRLLRLPLAYTPHIPGLCICTNMCCSAYLFACYGNPNPQEEDRVQECCAGLLGAVLVVLMEQRGHPDQLDVAVSTLMSHLHCYMLALAAERVSRDTYIWLEPPTLANLFDEQREVRGRR